MTDKQLEVFNEYYKNGKKMEAVTYANMDGYIYVGICPKTKMHLYASKEKIEEWKKEGILCEDSHQ